jgi:hypothetical protein
VPEHGDPALSVRGRALGGGGDDLSGSQTSGKGSATPVARAHSRHRALTGQLHTDRRRARRWDDGEGESSLERGVFPTVKSVAAAVGSLRSSCMGVEGRVG